MTEQIQDAYNSIKDRFKNSFIITFLVVWSVKHWELIYTVANFDNIENRLTKTEFIKKYISEHSMIWEPLCASLVSLVVLYILFIFSDIIHSFYNLIRVNALAGIRSKKVVALEEYNRVGRELDRIRTRAGEFQRKESEYILSKQELEQSVVDLNTEVSQYKGQLELNDAKLKTIDSITEENNSNKLSNTHLQDKLDKKEQELNGLRSSNEEKDKTLRETQGSLAILQLENAQKSAFQVWIDKEAPHFFKNWLILTDKQRENFSQTYFIYKNFKDLFGNDSWFIKSSGENSQLSHQTITLTEDIKPTFVTTQNVTFLVTDISFANNNIRFTMKPFHEAQGHKIYLELKNYKKYQGTENNFDVEFNRIATDRLL